MGVEQPSVGATVVQFPGPARSEARFHVRDRVEIARWRETAAGWGFDRLAIYESGSEAPEPGDYLCAYRCGEPWARWGFARRGAQIWAWCCRSGADVGSFATIAEALASILPGAERGRAVPMPPAAASGTVVAMRVRA
jgi:hypothetical protein